MSPVPTVTLSPQAAPPSVFTSLASDRSAARVVDSTPALAQSAPSAPLAGSDGVCSEPALLPTQAVFVSVGNGGVAPMFSGSVFSTTDTDPPIAIEPVVVEVQVMVAGPGTGEPGEPAGEQLQPAVATPVNCSFAPIWSVITSGVAGVYAAAARDAPLLLIWIVEVSGELGPTGPPVLAFEATRSANGVCTVYGKFAASLPGTGSVMPAGGETVAVFVPEAPAAGEVSGIVKVCAAPPLPEIVPEVQVICWPAATQPAGNVPMTKPAGTTSTMRAAVTLAGPRLRIVSVSVTGVEVATGFGAIAFSARRSAPGVTLTTMLPEESLAGLISSTVPEVTVVNAELVIVPVMPRATRPRIWNGGRSTTAPPKPGAAGAAPV